MINANELRIGNKIRYSNHILTASVIGRKDGYIVTEEGINGFLDSYDPIHLTSEILSSAGLQRDEKSGFGGWLIPIAKDENIRIICDSVIGRHWPLYGHTPVIVDSVHKLQNLYFVLTQRELKIDLR